MTVFKSHRDDELCFQDCFCCWWCRNIAIPPLQPAAKTHLHTRTYSHTFLSIPCRKCTGLPVPPFSPSCVKEVLLFSSLTLRLPLSSCSGKRPHSPVLIRVSYFYLDCLWSCGIFSELLLLLLFLFFFLWLGFLRIYNSKGFSRQEKWKEGNW